MLVSLLYTLIWRLLGLATLAFRSGRSKELEIVVLRHELAVLRRQVSRPTLSDADRVDAPGGLRHGLAVALPQTVQAEWRAQPGSNPRLSLRRIPILGRGEWLAAVRAAEAG